MVYANLDFNSGDAFRIDDIEMECDLPALQGACRVTFYNLPKDVEKVMS